MSQPLLLTVITFLPLLSVLAILFLSSEDHAWIRRIALAASVAEFIISLFLLRGFDMTNAGYQFEEMRNWIGEAIHYHLGVDGISLFLVLLTTFLTPIAILCSWESIKENVKGFFIAILIIETAMIGVFVSLDLFLFFVFWELTLIPMYFMIGMWGHDRRIYAAVKFILYTMFGSILMLVAILWLYNLTGTFDLQVIESKLQAGLIALPPHTELLLFGAFFLAFAIKVPLFPLHTWLPDAHTEAPTAGSVILAGVMLKLGTYGILRFCLPLFPYAAHRMAPLIGVLAIIGIVYGALVATVQHDLKRLVAYTSVSHLGFVVLGLFAFSTISVQGAIYQMLNHGISTGALFLGVGMLYDRRHTHEISEFGGLANPMPVLMGFFLFICLSSLALPPLNGFIGEFLILIGTFEHHHQWASWATSGAVLSAIYLLWSYQRVALGEVTVEKNKTLKDANGRERLILVAMSAMIIFMGIASPLFTRRMEPSTNALLRLMDRPQNASQPPHSPTLAQRSQSVIPNGASRSEGPLFGAAQASITQPVIPSGALLRPGQGRVAQSRDLLLPLTSRQGAALAVPIASANTGALAPEAPAAFADRQVRP